MNVLAHNTDRCSPTASKNHALVVLEALKITNMSHSAKGSLENPGKQVKAKSGLNKSILDQGWGEFKRQLRYKLEWLGGQLLEVDPKYTSQRCHRCGDTRKSNRLSQDRFVCQGCQHEAHADINAAKNILAAGHAVLACGEDTLVTSVKQELLGMGNQVPA
ncbi:MAG: transposase [Coxiellaceae bacterium]|nr:transposase [Coxiellaceae bacterium]